MNTDNLKCTLCHEPLDEEMQGCKLKEDDPMLSEFDVWEKFPCEDHDLLRNGLKGACYHLECYELSVS